MAAKLIKFDESPRLGFRALNALARWLGSRDERVHASACVAHAIAGAAAQHRDDARPDCSPTAQARDAAQGDVRMMDGDPVPRCGGVMLEKNPLAARDRLPAVHRATGRTSTGVDRTATRRWLTARLSLDGHAKPSLSLTSTMEGRLGFQRLVTEVSLGNVGPVLGVEMSRLARSCREWRHIRAHQARFQVGEHLQGVGRVHAVAPDF